jgi:hypothetical protein
MEEGESIVYGSRTPVTGIEYDWSSRSWTGEAVRSKGDSEQQSASLEFYSPTLAIRDPRARSQNRRLIYDFPLPEETGAWIPVSVPPNRLTGVGSVSQGRNAFAEDGGWFTDRAEYDEARELLPEVNLWNVLNGFIQIIAGRNVPQMSNEDMSTQTWPELSHRYSSRSGLVTPEYPWAHCHTPSAPPFITGSDLDVHARREVFDAEPPEWIPDSAASACMQCSTNFRALSCGRHHCRFCGGIFCRRCSSGRSLLPVKFQERDPQRVCDVCWERLEPIQQFLVDRVSNAAQSAVYDVTDMSCMRAWINSPLGLTMEHEIYKATNSLRSYYMVGEGPDKSIPDAVLDGAKGLAILTVLKVGLMVTYKMGTGLVVARKSDGTWSAPSAIASCGLGWGAQVCSSHISLQHGSLLSCSCFS